MTSVRFYLFVNQYYNHLQRKFRMKKAFQVIRNQVDHSIHLLPQNPKFSIIWLHGLGDSSQGFLDFFELPQSPVSLGARVKLLQAPTRGVTINSGAKMPSWYDMRNLDPKAKLSEQQRYSVSEIKQSMGILEDNVQQQLKYWKEKTNEQDCYNRIYVGGFSQGCATSLIYALTSKNAVAGIIGLSGHLFNFFDLPNLQKVPVLLYHGKYDGVIPIHMAKKSYEKILNKKNVIFKQENLEHSVNIEQLIAITAWLKDKTAELK